MASGSGSRKTAGGQRKKNTTGKSSPNRKQQYSSQDSAIFHEISLILFFALAVLLFLCNFGIIGSFGNLLSDVMFGLFGLMAYIAPVAAYLAYAFGTANIGSSAAKRKIIAGTILFFLFGILFELMSGSMSPDAEYNILNIYGTCSEGRKGGGIISGSLAFLLYHFMDMVGAVLVVLVFIAVCIVLLTEKSLIGGFRNSSKRMMELSRGDMERRKELAEERRRAQDEYRKTRDEEKRIRDEERRIRQEEKENEKILRMDRKVSGVTIDTTLVNTLPKDVIRDDIHEIILNEEENTDFDFDKICIRTGGQINMDGEEEPYIDNYEQESQPEQPVTEHVRRRPVARLSAEESEKQQDEVTAQVQSIQKKTPKKYIFPPLSRLNKGSGQGKDSTRELKETAMRLQQTLNTFGVRVTITDISQGPSVTRYELQPEQGVKVSKIVGLSDDIKLNLAATDIRIEAPIPGKAAIGIEVPNKENTAVALRDLLESKDFKDFPSNLAFAVGKDIGGKTVVPDIAKMPHMLIAGSTGSGKSVCINTLIMSILYKAHPDDVKLIMVDPKVVELSVYNGIPHLLIPVVTDPKKAAAALHWGVAEMTERYKKFADYNVRDLKGYNKKIESMKEAGDEEAPDKMPQIVIIVDELADLMMVAPGEVEESICRLAQLARAAGIHLIIATQRPSVDVITGLIKANMPSRVAFSVSSGVDSRTILDMNGAEKLLGKGDMLFYPQGYTKPARVQGAFISDGEVADVVEFLKNQTLGNIYDTDLQEKIASMKTGASSEAGGDTGSEKDQYFVEAARFIIERDKASIGMLQRVFKIGFNRAARIMDQLCEAGVVGEEEGTKPRKVLMSEEQFEQYIEECL